ncbi:PhzF family phenazine biosynthesis protein [Henriciella sp.]|uniref:PhzF family phenazine biosynthesis protein n=1 Tax=Henriciella sp. TaxID=1968823 RepID=UPI0026053F59|nr:PhzF family phenazine biosynthesis protein [Henriciella sp.]
MTTLPFYQIDAFASRAFEGNQACVMPLEDFLPDETLQAIAAENNVAETAYIVAKGEGVWALRWFTPEIEVPLCGHATLASAHVLFSHLGFDGAEIAFDTVKSGRLFVTKLPDGRYEMNFPAPAIETIDVTDEVAEALRVQPQEAWAGPYYGALVGSPEEIMALKPDLGLLRPMTIGQTGHTGCFGVLAPGGDGVDVTSRFFAPGSGIPEDPATGSWHCMVAAIMGPRLKRAFDCYQAYPGRGAKIGVELAGDRVKLRGEAVTVIEGKFTL